MTEKHTHTHNLIHQTPEVMNQEAEMYHHHANSLLEAAKETTTEEKTAE